MFGQYVTRLRQLRGPLDNAALYDKGGTVHNVKAYGALGNGSTDDRAAIIAAWNALPSDGGTVAFPPGRYVFSSPIDFSGKNNVRFVGLSCAGTSDGNTSTDLHYTGGGSTYAIKLYAAAVTFENIGVRWSSASFSGYLVDCRKTNGGSDTSALAFRECHFGHRASNTYAPAALFALAGTHDVLFDRCVFRGGQVQVIGKEVENSAVYNGFSVAVQFRSCSFSGFQTCAVKNADEAWVFDGCVGEPDADESAAFYKHDAGFTANLTIRDCWIADDRSTAPAGSWITFGGGSLTVQGGVFGCQTNTTGITIDESGLKSLVVKGTWFKPGNGSGIDFGTTSGHQGVDIGPLHWGAISDANKIKGTIPDGSRYTLGGTTVFVKGAETVSGALTAGSVTATGSVTGGTVFAGSAAAGNLLAYKTATMETSAGVADATNWQNNSSTTISSSTAGVAAHGTYSLKATQNAVASECSVTLTSATGVSGATAGTVYYGLASGLSDGHSGATIKIDLFAFDSGGSSLGRFAQSSYTAINSSTWTQVSCSGTAPANTASVRALIRFQGANGDVSYLDKVGVYSVDPVGVWTVPGTAQVKLTQSTVGIPSTAGNVDLELYSAGTSPLDLNVSAGTGTGGTRFGDGAGNVAAWVHGNGAIAPASLADGSAANGTIYYSTTQGKLVFKDSGGVVNNLY